MTAPLAPQAPDLPLGPSRRRPRLRFTALLRRAWPWIGALLFAGILASISSEGLKDRENYIAYIQNAPEFIAGWIDGNIVAILANEPLWLLLDRVLGLWLEPEQALTLLILIPAATVAYLVFRVDARRGWLLLAFLLTPQVLKNHVIHLRQGTAVAVFLTGWFAHRRAWRWGLMALAPFIHASFFFVLLLLVLARVLGRTRAPTWLAVAAFAILGLSIGAALGMLAQAVGARQSQEYEFTAAQGISGLGFLFWCMGLGLLLTQSRAFARQHLLEIGSVVFYLATYFLSPVTARVFESALLPVLLAALKMRNPGRTIYIQLLLAYAVLQWLMILSGVAETFLIVDE